MENEGFRGWTMKGGKLQSLGWDFIWEEATVTANCSHGCEVGFCLREHNCNCGIYSHKSLQHVVEGYSGNASIYGIIMNHGIVVEGQMGFRAESATIKALFTADFEVGATLKRNYPDVEILLPPKEIIVAPKPYDYEQNANRWQKAQERKQAREQEKAKRAIEIRLKYPEGPEAEKARLLSLLKGANRKQIEAFAKVYGTSGEYAERLWLDHPGGSGKIKPGEIAFESNEDSMPFVYVGSYRPPSDGSSIRILLGRNGILYKRASIERWDERATLTAARKAAIAEWE